MIQNLNYYMRCKFIVYFIIMLLTSCSLIVPIVKPVKYYSPKPFAQLVDYIPQGTIYIGTIKVVPGDDALRMSERRRQEAISKILVAAAEAGADYVVIIDIQKSNKDYKIDFEFSDGYTIAGEMFRKIE